MKYKVWVKEVPEEITNDTLWNMNVYRYALFLARECRGWYYKVRHNFSEEVLDSRLKLLTEIVKMLLYIIPNQRAGKIREPNQNYSVDENPASNLIEDF